VSFASPVYLLALLGVPLALGLYLLARRRSRRYAVRFTGVETLAGLLGTVPAWRRHLPAALFMAALAALALSLARPERTVAVPVDKASVVVVTDASLSMLATDVSPSRLDAARSAAHSFLDDVPDGLRVGFVGFSDTPHTLEDPTTDHGTVSDALDSLRADGGTATGDAVLAALEMLAGEQGKDAGKGRKRPPAAIVLLSDGKATTGTDPLEAARQAKSRHVPINTVALGKSSATVPGPGGQPIPVPPDPETLREMSQISGGRAFTADDADELDGVYKRLSSQLGTKKEKREMTAGVAAAGLALLLGAAGLGVRRTGRLP
jgi:Ca-activated chloride channel family protein